PRKVVAMRNFLGKKTAATVAAVSVFALSAVNALAVPTAPTLDVASYGDSLLTGLGTSVASVLPYAGVITAFAIGVGMTRRGLGPRRATKVWCRAWRRGSPRFVRLRPRSFRGAGSPGAGVHHDGTADRDSERPGELSRRVAAAHERRVRRRAAA